ncbi:hypothetical protein GCM10011375_12360 [Hymenobacter qilianensis]|nr:hypothetical protein GCM10011375_12360 [Hymenobacter qilianensis]
MPSTPVVVWFEKGRYQHIESLADLAQQIHKMNVTDTDLANQNYRLKNRLTLIYREGDGGPTKSDPIFKLDSMELNNYSSSPHAFLRKSNAGEWELRDNENNLVPLKAISEAKNINNFFKNEEAFRKLFPKAGI